MVREQDNPPDAELATRTVMLLKTSQLMDREEHAPVITLPAIGFRHENRTRMLLCPPELAEMRTGIQVPTEAGIQIPAGHTYKQKQASKSPTCA